MEDLIEKIKNNTFKISELKHIMNEYHLKFDWCNECKIPCIICSCGNNTCNGGVTDNCKNCKLSYAIYDKIPIQNYPFKIKFFFILTKFGIFRFFHK